MFFQRQFKEAQSSVSVFDQRSTVEKKPAIKNSRIILCHKIYFLIIIMLSNLT